MSTQLDAGFLRNVVLVASFRGDDHDRICACLLMLAKRLGTIDAGMVPADLCGNSKTALGIATGALLAMNLLEVCGRVRSSSPLANGRRVNALRIATGRMNAVNHWLQSRGYTDEQNQLEMAI